MDKQWYKDNGYELSQLIEQSVIDRAEREVIDAYIRPIVPDYGKYFDEKMILTAGDLQFQSNVVTSDSKTLTFFEHSIAGMHNVSNSLGVKSGDIVSISSDRSSLNIVKYHEYKAGEIAERVVRVKGSYPELRTATYKATEKCLVSFVGSQTQTHYEITKSSVFTDATIDIAIANLAFLLILQRTIFATRAGAKVKVGYNSTDAGEWEKLSQQAMTCHLALDTLRKQPYANKDAEVLDICKIYFKTNFFCL